VSKSNSKVELRRDVEEAVQGAPAEGAHRLFPGVKGCQRPPVGPYYCPHRTLLKAPPTALAAGPS